ncbi:MAG: hypothetical protein J6N52_09390 [Clostridia bacterium]|nr:hypothetical protein [Clostridia bacterium]
MMNKKILGMIGAALCCSFALSGCGSEKGQENTGGKTQISWTAWLGAPVNENADMIKYWNDLLDVDIDVWNIEAANYSETIALKIAGGEIPDVLYIPTMASYTKYAKDGILAEFTDEQVKEYAPKMYETYKKTDENALSYRKVDGKLYGLPALTTKYRRPMAYRGDWMENLGETKLPETLDEFETLMYKSAKNDPDGDGTKNTYGLSAGGVYAVYGAYGIVPEFWMENENGELVFGGVQPKMKEALALLRKWYSDGVLDPEFIVSEKQSASSNMSTPFVNGKIGFTANGEDWHFKPKFDNSNEAVDWEGDNVKELRKIDSHAADSIRLGLPVKGPHGDCGLGSSSVIGTKSATVSFSTKLQNDEKKLKKIFEVLETIGFTSYDNLLTAKNGIKGVHWDFNEKNQIVYLDEKYQQYTERAKIGAHTVMTTLASLEWNNEGKENEVEWRKETKADYGAIENKLKTVLESEGVYGVELEKLRSEAYISIITGSKDLDYFDEFVRKWNTSGGEQLTKEANEWYKGIK